MFKKLMVTALWPDDDPGCDGHQRHHRIGGPRQVLSKENMLVVTVVAYGKSRSIEPEMVAMTRMAATPSPRSMSANEIPESRPTSPT